jgi:hypothetical protein
MLVLITLNKSQLFGMKLFEQIRLELTLLIIEERAMMMDLKSVLAS